MQFQNPEFLLLAPILILLFFLVKKFVGKKRLLGIFYSNFRNMRKNADNSFYITPFLDIFAVLILIIALARPVSLEKEVTPPIQGKDIFVALDISTSMEALDFQPDNRLETAKRVIDNFVESRKTDRLGLVFFAGDSFLQVPLTSDYAVFRRLLASLKTGVVEDGTAIGNGLGLALSRLEKSKSKSKVIILLSDGDDNSSNLEPLQAAEIAKKMGVKIYSILIGKSGMVPYPTTNMFGMKSYTNVQVTANPKLLKSVAETSGGRFYQSVTPEDLKKAFADIDKLEKSPVPTNKIRFYKEYAPIFILAAMILFIISRIFTLIIPVFPEVER